jgi:aryl-alcohol dehydrogenase-like predicted oxidoreductase
VVKKYLDDHGRRILAALDDAAQAAGATPGQVAIAWVMAQPAVAAPIASATSLGQLDDLVRAAQLKLDGETLDRLTRASAAA